MLRSRASHCIFVFSAAAASMPLPASSSICGLRITQCHQKKSDCGPTPTRKRNVVKFIQLHKKKLASQDTDRGINICLCTSLPIGSQRILQWALKVSCHTRMSSASASRLGDVSSSEHIRTLKHLSRVNFIMAMCEISGFKLASKGMRW